VNEYLATPDGQRYSTFVAGLRTAVVDFSDDSEKIETDDVAKVIREAPLAEANSVSSRYISGSKLVLHKPLLDIDVPAMLVPSTTPGHHHLYIDVAIAWEDYAELLKLLGRLGILQTGYVRACLEREASWLRTPWTRKDVAHAEI
jgi:hypothetical protein